MQKKYALMSAVSAVVLVVGMGKIAFADRGPGVEGGPAMEMMGMPDFKLMDADKDGALTVAEVEAYRAAQIAKADANADGKLNAEELVTFQQTQQAERMADRAAQMIERFDTDDDGLLSGAELASGPREQTMFERVDADGDGSVTAAEAAAAKTQMASRMMRGGRHGRGHGPEMRPEMGAGSGPEN